MIALRRRWLAVLLVALCGLRVLAYDRSREDGTAWLAPAPHVDAAAARLLRGVSAAARVVDAVAADVDRDGDLDVIASTTADPIVVFVNDGHGHLEAHALVLPQFTARPSEVVHQGGADSPAADSQASKRFSPVLARASLVAMGRSATRVRHSSIESRRAPSLLHLPSRAPPAARS